MNHAVKKILVIDDSNTNLVLLEAVLTKRGYKTLTALTVSEALSLLKNEKPELILLDLLMPGIDGYEFLDDVKRNESTKHIPVIIVSAVTNSKEIKKTKMLGAVDYIEKPVNIHELVNKIETTLNN